MRHIDKSKFIKCKTKTWDRNSAIWSEEVRKAENHADKIKEIGNKWSSLKRAFVKEFGAKCWYTEAPQIGTDYDVDHFLPKGRVKIASGEILSRDNKQHPGYWWKAFDIDNYRYSCIYANRSREEGGKVDYFPVSDESHRCWDFSDQSDYEYRVILDPCSIEDVQLISFKIETGKTACIYTEEQNPICYERVRLTKKILNLDETTIYDARMKAIKEIESIILLLQISFNVHDLNQDIRLKIQDTKKLIIEKCNRKSPFSAAVLECILPYKNEPYLADILDKLDLAP